MSSQGLRPPDFTQERVNNRLFGSFQNGKPIVSFRLDFNVKAPKIKAFNVKDLRCGSSQKCKDFSRTAALAPRETAPG